MKKRFIMGLLTATFASTTAWAAGDFSAAQLNAWQAYCKSELDGDKPYCDCLLKAQVDEIGDKTVRLNLDSMVADSPTASAADIGTANKALESVSEKDFADSLMLFELSLDTASEQCEG